MSEPHPGDPGFGIYIHWPFCRSKCPYCDFNSHVFAAIDQPRWRAALLRELAHFAEETAGRTVTSVFFGGGTPSLMEPETTAALIAAIHRHWPVTDDVEISLEANPTSVEAARFAAYRAAGVNRLSLGVQALDPAALAFLGRQHDVGGAVEAIALARRTFPRMSFDLIYARPGQTTAAWREELARAVDLAADHLSVYQLTIEPGTAFHTAHARGDFTLPDEDAAAELYETTQEELARRGLPAYEVSNHARPGAECRHNLLYWRGGDYVGVGPGAHGRLTRPGDDTEATRQIRSPERWLEAVERDGHGTKERTAVASAERIAELLMMGLRLLEGIDLARFRGQAGRTLDEAVDREKLAWLIELGLLDRTETRLRATPEGVQRLNAVLAELIP